MLEIIIDTSKDTNSELCEIVMLMNALDNL